MPAFYHGPKGLDDLADFVVGRVLSVVRVRHSLVRPWDG